MKIDWGFVQMVAEIELCVLALFAVGLGSGCLGIHSVRAMFGEFTGDIAIGLIGAWLVITTFTLLYAKRKTSSPKGANSSQVDP